MEEGLHFILTDAVIYNSHFKFFCYAYRLGLQILLILKNRSESKYNLYLAVQCSQPTRDVSGQVESYSRPVLLFLHSRTTLTEITGLKR